MPNLAFKASTLGALDAAATIYGHKDKHDGAAVFEFLGGNLSGTVLFECALDDSLATWGSIEAVDTSDSANVVTSITFTGASHTKRYRVIADGLNVRARVSVYASGTVNVNTTDTRA